MAKYQELCSGCTHYDDMNWCARCKKTEHGTPTCFLHCSVTDGEYDKRDHYCATCINKNKCEQDSGFRDECIYNGTGTPTLWEKHFRPIKATCFGCPKKYLCEDKYSGKELSPQCKNLVRRSDILKEAKKCVCTDRNQQYGEPEDSFRMIGDIWGRYIAEKCLDVCTDENGEACCHVEILPEDVALMMVLFKVCRGATGEKITKDTLVDIAGYAACAGGMIE